MKKLSTILLLISLVSCKGIDMEYPKTKKIVHIDHYFGEEVQDPYQWLENDLSTETKEWVRNQNKVTFQYLDQIPYRNHIKEKMKKILNYERMSAPFKKGGYEYYFKNTGLDQHDIVFRKKNDQEEVFLNPNSFSKDGSISLVSLSFSKDGSLSAYQTSDGGSDWTDVTVIRASDQSILDQPIKNVKFSNLSWQGNTGFFYSTYPKPTGSILSDKTDQHQLFFHKIGTNQSEDKVIFGLKKKYRYVYGEVSEDQKYLSILASNDTTKSDLYIKKLDDPKEKILPIVIQSNVSNKIIDVKDGHIYIYTTQNAPNGKVVRVSINKLSSENWSTVIPESQYVLSSVSTANGSIYAHYLKDVKSYIEQYDYQGKKIRSVELPGIGFVQGFESEQEEADIYYTYTDFVQPKTVYQYNDKTGKSKVYIKPKINFDYQKYTTEQVFFTSKDGTEIPMFLIYRKNLKLDGKNPTILYGYGGFGISLTPNFSPAIATWISQGGIYAVVNLRGGGEYGEKWHDMGRKLNKLNVFDDFMSAAKFLYTKNYTSKKYTALLGGSNGGLLVAATLILYPEIAAVAIPQVGVLDMLKYHKFTSGAGWSHDYGTSEESKEMFDYLKSYSPVHNVHKGICYPATLVTTGDHDDRVVPAHSFKFVASLQENPSCNQPALIRIETKAGHGSGKSVEVMTNEISDIYSFILWNIGIKKIAN